MEGNHRPERFPLEGDLCVHLRWLFNRWLNQQLKLWDEIQKENVWTQMGVVDVASFCRLPSLCLHQSLASRLFVTLIFVSYKQLNNRLCCRCLSEKSNWIDCLRWDLLFLNELDSLLRCCASRRSSRLLNFHCCNDVNYFIFEIQRNYREFLIYFMNNICCGSVSPSALIWMKSFWKIYLKSENVSEFLCKNKVNNCHPVQCIVTMSV